MQPVAFDSRKLNPAETRYSAYERELLGIVWAIGKWRHYLEGKHFIVQTDHSSLRHLPNQPSVNRRIWKWVSILQGYDLEIRHIPGRINPADALTRQIRGVDTEYSGEVKKQDEEWVQRMRVPSNATDADIQRRLRQLYSTKDMQGTGDKLQAQLTTFNSSAESISVLAIAESTIQIDLQMRQRMMQLLQNEELYADILQHLQDPTQSDEIVKNEKVYRIKQGLLKIHEPDQGN